MAESVVSSAEGASDGVFAKGEGDHLLKIQNAAAWGAESVAIEVAEEDISASYVPATGSDGTAVAITSANTSRIVRGNCWYRMNVTGHAGNDITMTLHRCGG